MPSLLRVFVLLPQAPWSILGTLPPPCKQTMPRHIPSSSNLASPRQIIDRKSKRAGEIWAGSPRVITHPELPKTCKISAYGSSSRNTSQRARSRTRGHWRHSAAVQLGSPALGAAARLVVGAVSTLVSCSSHYLPRTVLPHCLFQSASGTTARSCRSVALLFSLKHENRDRLLAVPARRRPSLLYPQIRYTCTHSRFLKFLAVRPGDAAVSSRWPLLAAKMVSFQTAIDSSRETPPKPTDWIRGRQL